MPSTTPPTRKRPNVATDRLHAAHIAAHEGRHEFALAEYVWFHHHALEVEPSLYGVRLSFALSHWKELGEAYPPARLALTEIRDAKTATLLAAGGDKELFIDVCAINEYLDEPRATHALFIELEGRRAELAWAVAHDVLEVMVAVGDFSRAAQYMPPPKPEVERMSAELVTDVAGAEPRPPRMRVAMRRAYCRIYADRVLLFASILDGNGRAEEARQLRILALDLVAGTPFRKAVAEAFRDSQVSKDGTASPSGERHD